ncbi:MAG: Mut7-C RNAse domain-containing protein [Candidatus Heimdallarchaeota archaeon]|nr:Mut7-C RNAse domain-containing protein [Candidatus Heimdallarchaeota archaeon]MCK4252913.1 Mut7-C RNAse domain-containing protein [Candidatus Heimdallarchaeota archaeon]
MNRFYADSMLGKLARFLRFLGYDTLYRSEEPVEKMLETSIEDNRIVLSKSENVVNKCNKLSVKSFFISSNDIEYQLRTLHNILHLELSTPPLNTRCSVCNNELIEKDKQEIISLIPKRTAGHYDRFWQCTTCEKIYWIGSHWKDIEKIVASAKAG